MKIRFVTSNPGKLREATAHLSPLGLEVESAAAPIVEIQADTLEEVARAKAESIRGRVEPPYFVEDAGLFVDALSGFPGVYSHYAYRTIGWQGLLRLLHDGVPRTAAFRAVIGYVAGTGAPGLFAGEALGRIASAGRGGQGFGFDPIFVPDGESRTFAELGPEEKSHVSHRGRALEALAAHLSAHVASRKG